VLESYTSMVKEALDELDAEEWHHICKLFRLNVYARTSELLEIKGVFIDLEEEAKRGLSPRKLSPLSV
jgi:hypothetical protein